jgi:hypothetical protein
MLLKEITGIQVYRGISPQNLPKRYPGTFWTQNKKLAQWYSRGGEVIKTTISPKKTLNIDTLSDVSAYEKYKLLKNLQEFIKASGRRIAITDTQLYDNLQVNSVSDFSYPTQTDVDFLRALGYDSVYFSREGGQQVDTWFIFD